MIKNEGYWFIWLTTGFFILCGHSSYAQWNWPEDRAKAEGRNAYYTDQMKNELYRDAANGLYWLMVNAPDLNSSLYINGAKIYESLAEQETDPAQKMIYQDSALLMYDLRIKYFNQEARVLNRKTYKAYRYYRDREEKYGELFELFQRTFELNGNNVLDNNLIAYLDVARRYRESGGDVNEESIIEIYSDITEIIDYKISAAQDDPKTLERMESYQDTLDKLLTSTVPVDCEFVEETLVPKLENEPDNIKLVKKVFQLLLKGKCTESPYFLMSAKKVHEMEPTYGLAIVIAKKELSAGNFPVAQEFYLKAYDLTDDPAKKGEIFMDLATTYASKRNKESARGYALKAVKEDSNLKEAYSLIGNLYMQSYEDCRQGVNKVEDRGCFLAAYKMFQLAGDAEGMRNSRQQFPSIEEIFELDLKEGDSFTVGCWIDETVKIQRRPS